ncbi:hypothetical protein [Fusobacterium sp.]|uniref:hypothetical protein n=1 Tax=Fusobacterium sp. TaxID=68766 RepID=UPI00290390D1|nr:hypothetical protein [Fusobacterium sp.]MDU1912479.1 hypothetical protein [Fusobacterium sp.]
MEGRCKRCNKRLYWFRETEMYRGEEYCSRCYDILFKERKKGIEINGEEIIKKEKKSESDKKVIETLNDKGGIGWVILGFLSAYIGIILFAVFNKKYPKRAKSLLMGGILSIIFPFFIFAIMMVVKLISES